MEAIGEKSCDVQLWTLTPFPRPSLARATQNGDGGGHSGLKGFAKRSEGIKVQGGESSYQCPSG